MLKNHVQFRTICNIILIITAFFISMGCAFLPSFIINFIDYILSVYLWLRSSEKLVRSKSDRASFLKFMTIAN